LNLSPLRYVIGPSVLQRLIQVPQEWSLTEGDLAIPYDSLQMAFEHHPGHHPCRPKTRERVIIEAPPADAETPTSPNTPDAAPRSEKAPKQEESDRRRRAPSETSAPAEPRQAPPIDVAPKSPPPGSPLPAAVVAETVPVAQASAPSEASQPPLPETARWHVVEPGESLWSIATRLLGPDATPGRIAREVERLWELNKDRIGTGDRDLLMVGAKLRLR
jgi:LysM domain